MRHEGENQGKIGEKTGLTGAFQGDSAQFHTLVSEKLLLSFSVQQKNG